MSEDPGIRQLRELTRLIKAGVPPNVALSLVQMWRSGYSAGYDAGRLAALDDASRAAR